ncbi:hypothetical protein FMM08_22340 [Quadrisphaera setariae]|uniref:HTH iclR-type domain-containing protein n=1 Tax=Quadrisphaera setariae TaxID=2593304 RepID=A0A5C8Z3T1_9ACTN|nr:hypothetical protein FMM08_22340 [Quadrisphaera setariae]
MHDVGGLTVARIADRFGGSRATIYRHLTTASRLPP